MKHYNADSSDDDVILEQTKNNKIKTEEPVMSKDELYKKNRQKCFLCDIVLYNNYEVLVHNAEHVIIPIGKCESHQCRECLSMFRTKQQLYMHVLNGHPEIINGSCEPDLKTEKETENNLQIANVCSLVKGENILLSNGTENILNRGNEVKNEDIPTIELEKERENNIEIANVCSLVKGENTLLSNGINNILNRGNEVKNEDDIPTIEIDESDEEKPELEILSVIENMVKRQPIILCKTPSQINNEIQLKTVILEKCVNQQCTVVCDYDDEILSTKIPRVKKPLIDENVTRPFHISCSPGTLTIIPYNYDENLTRKKLLKDRIQFEEDIQIGNDNILRPSKVYFFGTKKPMEDISFPPSIHYDELTVPDNYKCRYCNHVSGNRFDSIVHETCYHLKTNTRIRACVCVYCDRHIAGNYYSLRKHVQQRHKTKEECERRQNKKCIECGLNFHNIYNHVDLFHKVYKCEKCFKGCITKYQLDNHECKPPLNAEDKVYTETQVVKMCDVCFMLRKPNKHKRFVYLKDISEIGEKQVCQQCHKSSFSIRLVKTVTRKHPRMHGNTTSKWKSQTLQRIERNMKRMKHKHLATSLKMNSCNGYNIYSVV